jgi:hypothetical protein
MASKVQLHDDNTCLRRPIIFASLQPNLQRQPQTRGHLINNSPLFTEYGILTFGCSMRMHLLTCICPRLTWTCSQEAGRRPCIRNMVLFPTGLGLGSTRLDPQIVFERVTAM